MATVMIIDDHALLRDLFAAALTARGFVVTASGSTVREAIDQLPVLPPDAIMLDLDLGEERGENLLPWIRDHDQETRVLVVTGNVDTAHAQQMLRDGASGVVLKSNPAEVVIQALHAVLRGEQFMDPSLTLREPADAESDAFTERERRVFQEMYRGSSNKEIAAALEISEAGVKAALQRLFRKTGVRTRGQLVRIALELHPELLDID